ncbi:hypothetical protein ACRALDRAFT_1040239 [Sodiomyces alcalophilus JCM 7366]|uniref:uncharacterized protein n=1 Tax=Sodiomyces alcalophilus JCM 7366 TaxID=591952 RepID=UPI0039B5C66A
MMMERRCAMTDFPAERVNADGFYQKKSRLNTLPLRGGHFIKEDLSLFDADFFSISPNEATSMDPMQRWLLEAAYLALENAGIPMESINGSSTGVYTGSFSLDYMLQLTRDSENPPTYAAVGFGLSMLANRLSWFFNLHGPSIGLDSACSSTAMALDIACQSLRNGSCNMAMLAGCNLANSPEAYVWMSNINFLSPDSRCHSFDHRANGYARGEGIGVVVLKRLSDAIRDGNTIRAVIRATGSNEDGKTPGITQPSRQAQERLIRETYQRAGLSMAHTRFFEAHGTGTPIGDPREAQAIGSAFQKYRSADDPIYVGALKSNIGHLEGASGLAGLLKAVLALEKGIIPPNTNFEKVNPKIDTHFLKIKFPEQPTPWPTAGLRRASINSFGYGGSNSHVVLDDAYNYLRLRSLQGKHCTVPFPPRIGSALGQPALPSRTAGKDAPPKLLTWSTTDKGGIKRIAESYKDWYDEERALQIARDEHFLANLAYTLDTHRSHLGWRSFALLKSPEDLRDLQPKTSPPVRVKSETPRLGFIFSGQGAQWFAMGRELLAYASYKAELDRAEEYLATLGCQWSPIDELSKTEAESNVDKAEYSQTLCTVVQVALVNLLRKFGVRPSAVVGHSSGEIAAAYAAGALSCESAWKVAYFRGLCSAELAEASGSQPLGAMMSVGLPEAEARELIAPLDQRASGFGLSIACINSPVNVTISGEDKLIDQLKTQLDEKNIFARKLRVALAYHSRQMEAIASKYTSMMGTLPRPQEDLKTPVPMISSVTGERIDVDRLAEPSYWALNMVSPVRFSQAVTVMCAKSQADLVEKIDRSHIFASVVDHLVEVGPHAALQGPLRDILRASPRGKSIGYSSVLRRGQSATETVLRVAGDLHCMGLALNLRAVNEPEVEDTASRSMLVDLPQYPFDHSQRHWHESRLSRNYRLRVHAPSELLGVRSRDWNAADARWRHFIRLTEMPWADQHVVNGTILYPGAGMLVMAIEAAKQLAVEAGGDVTGYTLRDVHIEGPMDLTTSAGVLEVQTSLRAAQPSTSQGEPAFEFVIRSFYTNIDDWRLNCRGFIAVELKKTAEDGWQKSKAVAQRRKIATKLAGTISQCDTAVDADDMYGFLKESGYGYGPVFQAAQKQRYNEQMKQAAAEVNLYASTTEPHVIHPASLDCILHLCFTGFTAGGTRPMATCIPTRIGSLWVSDAGLSAPENESVTACLTVTGSTKRGFTFDGGALASPSSDEVRLWYEDIEITNITSVPPPPPEVSNLPDPKQFCMNIDTKVAIDKLSPQETVSYLDALHPIQQDFSDLYRDLELLALAALDRLTSFTDPSIFEGDEPWKKRYWTWAQHHLANARSNGDWEDAESPISKARQSFDELAERLANTNHVGRLYSTVATNLGALLRGEATPLELLMHTGQLKEYYAELATYRDNAEAAGYMDLLAHQTPGMKILEVGGGTASATRKFIRALASGPADSTTSLRCSRYDFTDVSSAFLENAREEFGRFQAQMTFGTLDIERDIAEQGYEEGTYDVVVADNVLHVTSNLHQTLRNVRKALKPGGKLIMHELLRPDGWTAGFIFGLFPGWWLAKESERPLSPNLGADEWHAVLAASGFSGTDMVFRDFDDEVAHHLGCLVSTAISDEAAASTNRQRPQLSRQVTIIVDPSSSTQQSLAEALTALDEDVLGMKVKVTDLGTAASTEHTDDLVVVLLDYGESSFVASFDEASWAHVQSLVRTCRRLLWVSAGGGREASPDHGLLDGLARTLRFEYYELQLVTVALDLADANTKNKVSHLVKVASEMASRLPLENYEQEYVETDGLLHTRRLVEAQYLKADMESRLMPYEVVSTSLGRTQTRFAFSNSSIPGLENASTPHYDEYNPASEEEEPEGDTVEIAVKAVSLQYRDRVAALGHEEEPTFGDYFAGVVLRTGPAATTVRPGDRVLAAQAGSFRSHVRVSSQAVAALPDDVSFADACAVVGPAAAAYHALVDVGRVRRRDVILVHDGASPIGQAALRLLADEGVADVWVTASNESDSTWITQNLGVSEERVLPKSWFEGPSMLASQWKQKFDIVLCPYTDITSPLSLKSVRSGGRSIVLRAGPATSSSGTAQQVHSVPASISLSIVQAGPHTTTADGLEYAVSTAVGSGLKSLRRHVTEFSASEISGVYSHLQSADEKETIVVNLKEEDVIDIRTAARAKYALDPNGTYVVAGGLGGLGRSLARWLAGRGARYIILLSRSGPRTEEAKGLVAKLQEEGVHVETPPCDITDRTVLRRVLDDCAKRVPPIKGCIQASMVMTERIFQQMSYNDWKVTIDPKVKGSWNLHTELPRDLDFFVFTSSMMGIMGSGSLTAYNAGNTYEDALAHYRVQRGEHAVALNLGAIPDAGYLVEAQRQKVHIASVLKSEKYALTYVKDVCALMEVACDPATADTVSLNQYGCQAVVGIRPLTHWKHVAEVHATMYQPFWGHMHHFPVTATGEEGEDGASSSNNSSRNKTVDAAARLAAAGSLAEAAEVASEALVQRVSALLGTAEENVDVQNPMHSYGLDSLSAIDVRNWVGKVFDVDMPVFEILGGATFAGAGMSIARKVQARK